jgi:hypothetical protein
MRISLVSTRDGWVAALLVGWFMACGGDDAAPSAAGTGPTQQSGGSGGAVGDGGTGAGGVGTGGAGGTAGAGASSGAGGKADAGPMCTPRDQVKQPVYPTVQLQSSCTHTACGGSIADGQWAATGVCLDARNLFGQAFARCSAATVGSLASQSLTGTLTFTGTTVEGSVNVSATASINYPNACHGCQCSRLETELISAGVTGARCNPVCSGGTCFCTVSASRSATLSGAYSVEGTDLVMASGARYAYCASNAQLTLRQTSGGSLPGAITLRPQADTVTPEICDGVDNDKNGMVDDKPVECPTECNTKGVCAEYRQTCAGRSGWTCEYTSPALERNNETLCDGLDNDCDGLVDEDLVGCFETCDGIDNDRNGMIDDNPRDPPTCPKVLGACAAGGTATCGGSAGWKCAYTSTEYEPEESKCDGLDNDCDGLVDEGCGCATGRSKMYVVQRGMTGAIVRANLDGTGLETIHTLPGGTVFSTKIDPIEGKVYFWDFATKQMHRIPLGGGAAESVWTGDTQQWTFDPAADRMYTECTGLSNICAFDLATPTTNTRLVSPAAVAALEIDLFQRKIYWADHAATMNRQIRRANLDGSAAENVFGTGTFSPESLVVDGQRQRLYYYGTSAIVEIDLVARTQKTLVSVQNADVSGVALDVRAGKIYWSERATGQVQRANLDGTSIEPVLTGVASADDIALFLCAP